MEEKRNVKRFEEEIEGTLHYPDKKDPLIMRSVPAKVIDISLHGTKISSAQYFPVYSKLKITLNLTRSNQVLKIDAKIIWAKKKDGENSYEMGLEFHHDLKTIENLHRHLYEN